MVQKRYFFIFTREVSDGREVGSIVVHLHLFLFNTGIIYYQLNIYLSTASRNLSEVDGIYKSSISMSSS